MKTMRRFNAMALSCAMILGMAATPYASEGTEAYQEAPMLAEKVAAGELPAVEDRLPAADDIYVEAEKTPENPVYGGTLRTPNGGMWYYGPIAEEPLFRLNEEGDAVANVALGYDVSDDGLTYTIHLREGMKWSDGEPFTAEDCVYYYNYMLVPEVNNETGEVTFSYTGKYYNWYMTQDPEDGLMKPAIVKKVDDTTFTIQLYSPKPTLLQAIAIDNKWMFAPKHWYKDIVEFDSSKEHWTGETDLSLIGGNDLEDVTQEEALANAAAKNARYTFEDYNKLGDQLGYRYWQYAGRPSLRAWNNTSELTDQIMVFERNPYYWKVDAEGRQLPYIDEFEFISMDDGLNIQEMIAGNIDVTGAGDSDFPTLKASEAIGNYRVETMTSPNWSVSSLSLNQTYSDEQYVSLFENIDFRHALSIAVDRDEMNQILFNGIAVPAQFAAPEGTDNYIEGAPEKWIEMDVDQANELLDGIDGITDIADANADGYRTFTDGANAGKAIVLEIDTAEGGNDAQAVALLGQYYKKIGIQVVERSNSDPTKKSERVYGGDVVMSTYDSGFGIFNVMLRPDYVAATRNNNAWLGKYGFEHLDTKTPEPGSEMEKLVQYTNDMLNATTLDELRAATDKIVENHYENTWIIGFLNNSKTYGAISNRVQNFDPSFVMCDELRYWGNSKPYTWYLEY